MYSVWFCDLKKALDALEKVCPHFKTFTVIRGNVYGDFIIEDGINTYIVKHNDFSVWYLENGWRGKWIEVS